MQQEWMDLEASILQILLNAATAESSVPQK